tara:strand:+ start:981 stop:1520 length:540 start_codon:yes stop_codon:yes gene_type:complete
MTQEIPEAIRGRLLKKGIVVADGVSVSQLEEGGYGDKEKGKLLLKDYEAMFLVHSGKLDIVKSGETLSFDSLVDYAFEKDNEAWTRFLVYRDLRSRGYVVKEGFGFGIDFRVYERGEYKKKPAKFVIFGLNEGGQKKIKDLAESIDEISRMGKEPIVAVIERRGEIIYYKISKMRFNGV